MLQQDDDDDDNYEDKDDEDVDHNDDDNTSQNICSPESFGSRHFSMGPFLRPKIMH